MKKLLSIIIPAFNEEDNILLASQTILSIMDSAGINCELIFVSDGSSDKTFDKISELALCDNRVKGIEFSRNFGKEAAILAGLQKGVGDCFVVIDCDLQHPPETIVEMYKLWEKGYEIVEGIKVSRGKESFLYGKMAWLFYKLIFRLTGLNLQNTSDFKLIDKKVTKLILSLSERKTFFRALTFWSGFKSTNVEYEVAERENGTTKWTSRSLIKYAVTNVISFSSAPLSIVTYIGVISFIFSLILGIQTLFKYINGFAVEGFTTVILLLLILGACILLGLGLIGRYIAAIYDEIKQRPRYIIQNETAHTENSIDERQ